jgi:hypothetical protein
LNHQMVRWTLPELKHHETSTGIKRWWS